MLGDARRPRRRCSPRPHGADIRVLLDLVPNHTSDRAPVVRRSRASSRDSRAPRLVRLGRPEAGRLAAEQLGEQLRRPGVDARRRDAASTTCTTSCPSSPTSTGGTRTCATSSTGSCGSGSTAASPASASTSAHMIVKDRQLRDNPPATEDDRALVQVLGQRPRTSCRPEVHDVLRRWRAIADSLRPAPRPRRRDVPARRRRTSRRSTARATSCNLAFNIPLLCTPFEAGALRAIVERTEAALPAARSRVDGGNHDVAAVPDALVRRRPATASGARSCCS